MNSREFNNLPLTLSLETLGGIATPLVLRGTPLPAVRFETFSTASDDQVSVEVSLRLGERKLAKDNLAIGTFHLRNIPKAPRGTPQIRVQFSVNRRCEVTARAELQGSSLGENATFEVPVELTDEYLKQVRDEAERQDETDRKAIEEIDSRNRASNLLRAAEEKLKSKTDARLNEAVARLGLALEEGKTGIIAKRVRDVESLLSTPSYDFSDFFSGVFGPSQPARRTTSQAPAAAASRRTQDEIAAISTASQPLGRIFGAGRFTLDAKLCFVLMPFAEQFRSVYEDHIRPVVERSGMRCVRADDIHGTGLITTDIWEHINRARFLIADLSGLNPNVLYELGLADAISKKVIVLTRDIHSVPFDVRSRRCVEYEFTPKGATRLEERLAATIDEVIKSG